MSDPMRATAERLAREVYEKFRATRNGNWTPFDDDTRDILVEMFNHGLTHRDRTAEREAARKGAFDALSAYAKKFEGSLNAGLAEQFRDEHYHGERRTHERRKSIAACTPAIAAEFDAGERVTPTCERCGGPGGPVESTRGGPWRHSLPEDCITSLRDAVKRLAEQRGAER